MMTNEFLEFMDISLNPGKCTAFHYLGENHRYIEFVQLAEFKKSKSLYSRR
jgi:hypothetical protein